MRKAKKLLICLLVGLMIGGPIAYTAAAPVPVMAAAKEGFVKSGSKTYYYKAGKKVTGKKKIAGKYYLFDSNGTMKFGAQKHAGKYYYFDDKTGQMLTNTFKYIPKLDATYYYDAKGVLQYGPTLKVNGKTYKLDPRTGKLLDGNLKYKVTFVNGVTGKKILVQKVKFNQNAKKPATPTMSGYTFVKWDKSLKNVNEDRTITAVFRKNSYTVTFRDGLDNTTISNVTVDSHEAATAPAVPEHAGYTFSGWDKDFSKITGNITVTTLYEKNHYTVVFKDQVDGRELKTQSVAYGEAAAAPEVPTHPGYKFDKWDTSFDKVTENMTVTAMYQKESYTVTFKDGITGKDVETQTVAYGEKAAAPAAPAHAGYVFSKWDQSFDKITSNMTVTAEYTCTDGFIKDGDKTYYYKSGKALTGKQTIDGDTYYFNDSGVMQTGLQEIGSAKYYFKADGKMKVGGEVLLNEQRTHKKNKVTVQYLYELNKTTGKVIGRVAYTPYIWQQKGLFNTKTESYTNTKWPTYKFEGSKTRTFSNAGCGFASSLMAVNFLTGQTIDPKEVMTKACGFNGTAGDRNVGLKIASKYGIEAKTLASPTKAAIKAELLNGNPVMVLEQKSKFGGGGGHYVLLVGYFNGKFAVMDPSRPNNSWYYGRPLHTWSEVNSGAWRVPGTYGEYTVFTR